MYSIHFNYICVSVGGTHLLVKLKLHLFEIFNNNNNNTAAQATGSSEV